MRMRGRRGCAALGVVVGLGALVWLAAAQNPVGAWLIYGAWAVLIGGMTVRALRPSSRGHRTRAALEPTVDGLNAYLNLYLGRPDLGPVAYGWAGPPATGLTLDRVEPDPADLSHPDPAANGS